MNNLNFELEYADSLKNLLNNGISSDDRTGTGTKRLLVSPQLVIPKNHIPLLQGKYVNPYGALTEMIWILTGRTDLEWLKDNGVNYWDSWVKEDGTFGPIYGHQMRNQNGFDQLLYVINELKNKPSSRQALIALWNGSDLKDMALPVCHNQYQFLIINNELQLKVYQRSCDTFIGLPYDFMLFYFIQQIIGNLLEIETGLITIAFGDYHLYNNHHDAVNIYLNNIAKNPYEVNLDDKVQFKLKFPNKPKELTSESLTDWLYEFYFLNKNFETNYEKDINTYGMIKAKVSV